MSNPIPKTEIDRLVRNAINLKRPLSIASDKLMVANGKDQDLVDYFAFAHQEVVVSEDFERVVAESDIYQIMMGLRERDYPVMMEGIQQAKITAWWDRAVDIIPANGGREMACVTFWKSINWMRPKRWLLVMAITISNCYKRLA